MNNLTKDEVPAKKMRIYVGEAVESLAAVSDPNINVVESEIEARSECVGSAVESVAAVLHPNINIGQSEIEANECVASAVESVATVLDPNINVVQSEIEASRSETNSRNKAIAGAIMTMLELSSSDSDDDEEILNFYKSQNSQCFKVHHALLLCQKNPRNSIKNYVYRTVTSYTENEFRTHFRISRALYENLSQRFLNSEFYKNLRPDRRLSASAHMLFFLSFASHEACSFRDLSDRFNLSLSTISKVITVTTMFISSLSPEVIKWPNQERMEQSSQFFNNKCMFSKAIGCIDGTHIEIVPPKRGKDEYIDRKGNVSIVLQGICDENKKFIDTFVGYPGSSHDSWVFNNSTIYEKLPSYCGDYYLLGDSAYPCNKFVITPYRDNGHLTRAQKIFNCKLSSGRVAIEHTFGILKQRFRQLYYSKLRDMEKLCYFVRACCVLYNIANVDDLDFVEESTTEQHSDFLTHSNSSRGNNVRDPICESIQNRLNQHL